MMTKLVIVISTVMVLISLPSNAQNVLLEQDVAADTIKKNFGPNLRHYTHVYVGYGLAIGPDSAGSEIIYGASSERIYGFRYKLKLNKFYSAGADIMYHPKYFMLKQITSKRLPNDSLHQKEKLIFHNIGLGVYNRFNYGKRGNYLGNYIDIGANIDWVFSSVHVTKDRYDVVNYNNGGTVKVRTKGLVYTNRFSYDIFVRFGFNKFLAYVSYRLPDLFKKEYNLYPELPGIFAGVHFGISE